MLHDLLYQIAGMAGQFVPLSLFSFCSTFAEWSDSTLKLYPAFSLKRLRAP